jgi:hypothetical protein
MKKLEFREHNERDHMFCDFFDERKAARITGEIENYLNKTMGQNRLNLSEILQNFIYKYADTVTDMVGIAVLFTAVVHNHRMQREKHCNNIDDEIAELLNNILRK